jgi:hypothetical protein
MPMIVAAIYKKPKRGATAKLGFMTLCLLAVGIPTGIVSALFAHQQGLRHGRIACVLGGWNAA